MMQSPNAQLAALLDAIAAKQPTPGGGAVAAVCGALAAAIGEMVLNYSIGRKSTPHLDPLLRPNLDALGRARKLLLQLMVEDQNAFAALTDAKRLPDESADKHRTVTAAVQTCIAVPQEIGATAVAILSVADAVVDLSNKYLLSDLAVCCELAMACARSAVHNVHANLADVDKRQSDELAAWCDAELARAVAIVQRLMPRIATAAAAS